MRLTPSHMQCLHTTVGDKHNLLTEGGNLMKSRRGKGPPPPPPPEPTNNNVQWKDVK